MPTKGFGLVAFSGGTSEELEAAATTAGCARVVQAFFAAVDGVFIVFIPAAPAIVNAVWHAHFAGGIPVSHPLVMRCD